LVQRLLSEQASFRTTTKLLTQLARMQPLCIDELGYLNLKTEQVNAFFRLIDQRYGRVSSCLTWRLKCLCVEHQSTNKCAASGSDFCERQRVVIPVT